MAAIKPSSHGIVVDHKESGVRYAVSDSNYDARIHTKVRDLKPGETVRGFRPLRKEALGGGEVSTSASPTTAGDQQDDSGASSKDSATKASATK